MADLAEIISVNVGEPRPVPWDGREVVTAIWKTPVVGRVRVEGINLSGDDQADRRVHGGRDKAVYAYAIEDYAWWSAQLGNDVGPATFGENLTTRGIDLQQSVIGQRWQVGSAVFEVAQPRSPCFKLGIRMGDASFVDRFDASARTGAYLRIIESGEVETGDAIVAGPPPAHGLTIAGLFAAKREPSAAILVRIAANDDVPVAVREWARRRTARRGTDGRAR